MTRTNHTRCIISWKWSRRSCWTRAFIWFHAWYIPVKCASLIIAQGSLPYVLTVKEITGKGLRDVVKNIVWAQRGIVFYSLTACSAVLTWWRHRMEAFPLDWPFAREIHQKQFNNLYFNGSMCRASGIIFANRTRYYKGDVWNDDRYLLHIPIV